MEVMEAKNRIIELEKDLPEEARQILEHYGATLDDSGEPDNEAPDDEGVVTLPTPEEMEQERREWAARIGDNK